MDIELIKASEIESYAREALTRFESDIPISMPRARSQALNPDAKGDDILLITAIDGSKLLSFIGVYPAYVQNDPAKRIFWISCWWKAKDVSPEISRLVLQKFMEVTQGEVGVPHLPPHIIKILRKQNIETGEREGVMIRFRLALHQRSLQRSLKGKYHKVIALARNSGLLIWIDRVALNISSPGFLPELKGMDSDFAFLRQIPGDDYFAFIQENFKDHLTLPGKENISWICNHPWLVPSGSADLETSRRYYFSYISDDFHHYFPVLKKEGKIVGAAFISFREGVVKTLFLFVPEPFEDEFFRNITYFIVNNRKMHTLITYDSQYTKFLKKNAGAGWKLKNIRRYTGIANPKYLDLKPTDADGDSCFT